MDFYMYYGAVKYHSFQLTLTFKARTWYCTLKANTIGSLSEFGKQFLSHFLVKRRRLKTIAHLLILVAYLIKRLSNEFSPLMTQGLLGWYVSHFCWLVPIISCHVVCTNLHPTPNIMNKIIEGISSLSFYWSIKSNLCRNGTPRQPLLVPLARACLIFNVARVPPASLEGLGEYSHCWIMYIFHLNTDIEKLWKNPTKSKFKAKVCAFWKLLCHIQNFNYHKFSHP